MSAKVTIPIPEWLDRICTRPVLLYRQLKYGSCFRVIDLGEGECTIVDPGDYWLAKIFKWQVVGTSSSIYAARNVKISPKLTRIQYMHRAFMNEPEGLVIDHWNVDSLDNRRDNLRSVTHAENMHNRRKCKHATSKYIGVFFNKLRKKWNAQIKVNKKSIRLGPYATEIEAAKARDEAARKYFGEDAYLNFGEPRRRPRVEMLRAREEYARTGLPACLLPVWKTGELAGLLIKKLCSN